MKNIRKHRALSSSYILMKLVIKGKDKYKIFLSKVKEVGQFLEQLIKLNEMYREDYLKQNI